MRQEHDEANENDTDATDDDRQPSDTDKAPRSAKTRAGSNLPNAAGNRGDGSHE